MASNKKRNNQSRAQGKDLSFKIIYGLFFCLIALVPHLYKYKVLELPKSEQFYFGTAPYADIFSYYKSVGIFIVTGLLLALMVYQVVSKKIVFKIDKIDGLILAASGLMVASSMVSPYQDMVYFGAKGRLEGLFVWLCYMALVFIGRRYSEDKAFIRAALKVFMYSGLVMAFIAIIQVNNYDIYVDSFLKYLAYPQEIANNTETYITSIALSTGGFASLYNPNYLGGYMAMVTMVAVGFSKDLKALSLWLFPLAFMGLLVSNSEAGLLAFSGAFLIYLFVTCQKRDLNLKVLLTLNLMGLACILIGPFLNNQMNKNTLMILIGLFVAQGLALVIGRFFNNKSVSLKLSVILASIFVALSVLGVFLATGIQPTDDGSKVLLEAVTIEDNTLKVTPQGQGTTEVTFVDSGFTVKDGQGHPVDTSVKDKIYHFTSDGIDYRVKYTGTSKEDAYYIDLSPFYLKLKYEDEAIAYVDGRGEVAELERGIYQPYLYGHGKAFTNRGLTWSYFAKATVEKPLLGHGIETYMMAFPQNDHVAKYNVWGSGLKTYVDKPHNIYLQIGYGYGLVILILFMILLAIGLGMTWYVGSDSDQRILMALIAAFVIAGAFNDSTLGVTGPFMVFLGLSLPLHQPE